MKTRSIFKKIKFNHMKELGRNRHISRLLNMLEAIEKNFPGVNNPNQIRLKHLIWVNTYWFDLQKFSQSTRNDYKASQWLLVQALGRESHWSKTLGFENKGIRVGRKTIISVIKRGNTR
jgi:hypothetical protein